MPCLFIDRVADFWKKEEEVNTHLENLPKVVAVEHNWQPTLSYLNCQVHQTQCPINPCLLLGYFLILAALCCFCVETKLRHNNIRDLQQERLHSLQEGCVCWFLIVAE